MTPPRSSSSRPRTRPASIGDASTSLPLAGALAALAALVAAPVQAQESPNRFGVVNLAPGAEGHRVAAEVEKEVQRLRPGSKPIEELALKRLLATGEGPAAAGLRLVEEAKTKRAGGDCAGALAAGEQAEQLLLSALSFDEERTPLKELYALRVICAHQHGDVARFKTAALQLRSLVAVAPDGFPQDLWDSELANLAPPPATIELQIDSEPANAQIQVDLRGSGVTPRTLKVPPGQVLVEVQKEGFKKAHRRIDATTSPARTVFRLVPRAQDRIEQAQAAMTTLLQAQADLNERPRTLSRLAQLVRADTLVLVLLEAPRVRIWFFDAERGALADKPIDSTFDPTTGRIAALADRGAPAAAGQPTKPATPPAPGAPASDTPPLALPPAAPVATTGDALPEAQAQEQLASRPKRRPRGSAPWWSWAIAGAVAVGFGLFLFGDRTTREEEIGVRARWNPPAQ